MSKESRSSFFKDAIVLCLIAFASGLLLSFVFEATKGAIAERKSEAEAGAYDAIFPGAKDLVIDEELTAAAVEMKLEEIDPAYSKIKIDEVKRAEGKSDKLLGYAIVLTTRESYKSPITIAIGYDLNKQIVGIEYLAFAETMHVQTLRGEFRAQFIGKTAERFTFGSGGNGTAVDAVSGATVSSDALLGAINAGTAYMNTYIDMGGDGSEAE